MYLCIYIYMYICVSKSVAIWLKQERLIKLFQRTCLRMWQEQRLVEGHRKAVQPTPAASTPRPAPRSAGLSTPTSLRVVIVGDSGLQLNKRNNNIQEKDKYQIKKKIKQKT